MASVKSANTAALLGAAAQKLKGMEALKQPEWSAFVKTGAGKNRPPEQEDWWYMRAASVLRKLYLSESIGTANLKKVYGNRKNRGHKPEHKYKASGKVIRVMLQQLEAAGLAKKEKEGGRSITPAGKMLLKEAAEPAK